jgi:hypothetical protein
MRVMDLNNSPSLGADDPAFGVKPGPKVVPRSHRFLVLMEKHLVHVVEGQVSGQVESLVGSTIYLGRGLFAGEV